MSNESIYMAIASIITAAMSGIVLIMNQRKKLAVDNRAHTNVEVKTIFEGYAQIVEELRIEVERLMTTIAILQEEQAECEKRNDALIVEVEQLKQRLYQLEKHDGRK